MRKKPSVRAGGAKKRRRSFVFSSSNNAAFNEDIHRDYYRNRRERLLSTVMIGLHIPLGQLYLPRHVRRVARMILYLFKGIFSMRDIKYYIQAVNVYYMIFLSGNFDNICNEKY